jgi:hypothetical protein
MVNLVLIAVETGGVFQCTQPLTVPAFGSSLYLPIFSYVFCCLHGIKSNSGRRVNAVIVVSGYTPAVSKILPNSGRKASNIRTLGQLNFLSHTT